MTECLYQLPPKNTEIGTDKQVAPPLLCFTERSLTASEQGSRARPDSAEDLISRLLGLLVVDDGKQRIPWRDDIDLIICEIGSATLSSRGVRTLVVSCP